MRVIGMPWNHRSGHSDSYSIELHGVKNAARSLSWRAVRHPICMPAACCEQPEAAEKRKAEIVAWHIDVIRYVVGQRPALSWRCAHTC